MAKVNTTNIIIMIGLLVLSVTMPINCATVYLKNLSRPERDTDAVTTEKSNLQCEDGIPCGWAIYKPFTRTIDYFVQNTCKCTGSTQCVRTDDDLSVSAYVYKCRNKQS